MKAVKFFGCVFALFLIASTTFAQTGKITGTVTDASTGDPLPGVNVVVVGENVGSATDANGNYTILNVPPGDYNIRASFIGYAPVVQQGVRVNIGLTSEVNFELQEQTGQLDEVTVQATEPVVKRDVSASVANLSAEDVENLPVSDVEKVIGLQAGFERDMTIRGSGGSQVAFQVDGLSMASGRDNTPFTGISYTAVNEVQVQTGGFNAEYGNVRAGLVNVVTKEGSRDHYTADVLARYSSPTQKHFGPLPSDPNSYYMRPYKDDPNIPNDQDPAFVGTGVWDTYLQDSYPDFEGWNSLADKFDLEVTPEQMEQAFTEHYLRKDFKIDRPDYTIDGTIGGPVPGISEYLGDLRFTASYRANQRAYIVPYPSVREAYNEHTAQGKLTSNVSSNMKLQLQTMYATQQGMNPDEQGWPHMFDAEMPAYPWDYRGSLAERLGDRSTIFSGWRWNPMDVDRFMVAGQFTHTLGSNTFYETQLERMTTDYFTRPPAQRDTSIVYELGPIKLNETPFGFRSSDTYDIFGAGLRTAGHWGSGRDTSKVTRWRGRFDLTSQLNQVMQIKTGVEYILANYDTRFGEVDPAHPHHSNPHYIWERTPHQGAAYAQSKLEFQGMVANVGLRLDYFYPGGEWYDYSVFSDVLSAQWGADSLSAPAALQREDWAMTSTDRQLALSPRVGISFPITEVSKLYFNYGHFRQMLDPTNLFVVQEINTGAVSWLGNPNHPMPKTVAYELGYEQSLFEKYLLRVSGYYRDLSNQPRGVYYENLGESVQYTVSRPWNYEDVRGFEVTLRKNQGDWVRGFVNYTYMAHKGGNFGFGNIFQNPVEMREYLRTSTDYYQSKPIPEPFARFNLEFLVPEDLGPKLAGITPLGDWRINLLGEWRAGQILTWTGNQLASGRSPVRGLQNNLAWNDYYNLDLRLSKNFNVGAGDVQFYMDMSNVLNLRHMSRYGGFAGGRDQEYYLKSLHLPEETFEGSTVYEGGNPYQFIPGNDQPGDYRKPGTEFVPIEIVSDLPDEGMTRAEGLKGPLYYKEGEYYSWNGSSFEKADKGFVDQVLENKQYINMPNAGSYTFFNPRNVFFGLRLSF